MTPSVRPSFALCSVYGAAVAWSLVAASLGPPIRADDAFGITARDLSRMSPSELDDLFSRGAVTGLPVGNGRGRVLYVCDAHHPRLRAGLFSAVWKGKYFCADGRFTNQWIGFRAVGSHAALGPSWLDGEPCLVLEYPPGSPVFADTRDELREVAPGILLGRFYQRGPCPKLTGYFVLTMDPCGAAR
jgi:hypothetical protein